MVPMDIRRDSPDESQTAINVRVFPAFLQDRRGVLTATNTLGSRTYDLVLLSAVWMHYRYTNGVRP
jgi:hypothetical protein